MELMIIFGGICGLVIIVAIIAAVATVASVSGAVAKEDENED